MWWLWIRHHMNTTKGRKASTRKTPYINPSGQRVISKLNLPICVSICVQDIERDICPAMDIVICWWDLGRSNTESAGCLNNLFILSPFSFSFQLSFFFRDGNALVRKEESLEFELITIRQSVCLVSLVSPLYNKKTVLVQQKRLQVKHVLISVVK